MTNREMVQALSGSHDQKQKLYDYFFQRISQGEALDESEIPLFEAARKALAEKKTQVVTMSGHASGISGAQL